jgi:hypothetical protein
MPVDEDIDLNKPLTDAQIRKLEKDAEKMQKAAEKAEEARIKINNEMREVSSSLLEAEKFMGTGPLASMGGNDEFESTASNFLGIGGKSVDELGMSKGRRSGSSWESTSVGRMDRKVIDDANKLEIAALKAEDDRVKAEIKEIKNKQMLKDRLDAQKIGNVSKGFGKVNKGFSFMRNPVAFGMQSALGGIAKLGVYGAIAAMVIQQIQGLYEQVMTQIKDMYKEGGILDVRKDQLDSLRQVASLKSVIDMEQGRVFFTSDTGEVLRQGVPQATNTQGRVNGYKQYLQEYER